MNYKIVVAYDGTDYLGWQMQNDGPTIQMAITQALTRIEGRSVTVHGAGRTDSGVHAEGQVASFHLTRGWDSRALRKALNGNLPTEIRILDVTQIEENFHARFSALQKTYRYQIYNSEVMNPLLARYAWHYPYAVRIEKLRLDGAGLIGTQDFTAFTIRDCETKTNVRKISDFRVERNGFLLQLFFSGEGFLRYQVRTMVAALLEINRGRLNLSVSELILSRKRELIRGIAPAKGLTLMSVEY